MPVDSNNDWPTLQNGFLFLNCEINLLLVGKKTEKLPYKLKFLCHFRTFRPWDGCNSLGESHHLKLLKGISQTHETPLSMLAMFAGANISDLSLP